MIGLIVYGELKKVKPDLYPRNNSVKEVILRTSTTSLGAQSDMITLRFERSGVICGDLSLMIYAENSMNWKATRTHWIDNQHHTCTWKIGHRCCEGIRTKWIMALARHKQHSVLRRSLSVDIDNQHHRYSWKIGLDAVKVFETSELWPLHDINITVSFEDLYQLTLTINIPGILERLGSMLWRYSKHVNYGPCTT